MPDITMCKGKLQPEGTPYPLCSSCYRKNATPSEYRQSYFMTPPRVVVHDSYTCDYYAKEVL
jgi:hypothetical protein